MNRQKEGKPQRVSEPEVRTSPGGDVRSRWEWAEPAVWTKRMLTTLENEVRGGKWHSLIDKVYAKKTLEAASRQVAANEGAAGVDHVTIDAFGRCLEENLDHLHRSLKDGTYRPQAIRRVYIPKPGSREKRPLGIPTVRDRVAQTALKQVLEPIFERDFAEQSYGFRPGRSCKDALRRVDELLKADYSYIVDADLKSYFDTIQHDRLIALIGEKVSDRRILALVEQYLKQGIMEDQGEYEPEEGSPQGAPISPLLSNIYLDGLDHLMAEGGLEMIRYADDFVLLCRTQAEAEEALNTVRVWVAKAGLQLHPEKTCIRTHEEGFDFLGYHFEKGERRPRTKSLKKLKDEIRAKTKRANGHSLNYVITEVNQTLRGWYAYYKHSHKYTFGNIDGWVRMRLRSILRKREKRSGPGRGYDHIKWPNAFFADLGLFSLETAHRRECQSSTR